MIGEPAETVNREFKRSSSNRCVRKARSTKNLLEHVLQRVFATFSAGAQVLPGAFMLRTDAECGAEFGLGAGVHTERFGSPTARTYRSLLAPSNGFR